MPVAQDGEVLRRTVYLSLDPYMRGRMSAARSYAPSVELGGLMVGGTVSEVVESRHPSFAKGDFVAGMDGWQQFASSPPTGLRKLDPQIAPISTALRCARDAGLTAYVGAHRHRQRPARRDVRRVSGVGRRRVGGRTDRAAEGMSRGRGRGHGERSATMS